MSDRRWKEESMGGRDPQAELAAMQRKPGGEAPTPRVTFEPQEPRLLTEKGRQRLISMTFQSSLDGGLPHVVTLGPDGIVRCTCKAMLSIEYRPTLCWAAQEFRGIAGLATP